MQLYVLRLFSYHFPLGSFLAAAFFSPGVTGHLGPGLSFDHFNTAIINEEVLNCLLGGRVPYRFWCVIPLSNALKCYGLRAFATPPNLRYILGLTSL